MNWSFRGHEWQKKILEKLVKNVPKALLLTGPKGVGKLQIAKDFSLSVFLSNNYSEEINKKIDLNIFEDLIVLDKLWIEGISDDQEEISKYSNINQSHRSNKSSTAKTDTILIDDVHEIINSSTKSSFGGIKIIIIRDIERMNNNSFNAFLKTLEEPSQNTFFICTSSNIYALPSTILSRLQIIKFSYLSEQDINSYLGTNFTKLNNFELSEITKYSFGKISNAIQFVLDPNILISFKNLYDQVEKIFNGLSILEKLNRATLISENFDILEKEIEVWFYFLHDTLLTKKFDSNKLQSAYINLILLNKNISENVNKKLALENYYLSL